MSGEVAKWRSGKEKNMSESVETPIDFGRVEVQEEIALEVSEVREYLEAALPREVLRFINLDAVVEEAARMTYGASFQYGDGKKAKSEPVDTTTKLMLDVRMVVSLISPAIEALEGLYKDTLTTLMQTSGCSRVVMPASKYSVTFQEGVERVSLSREKIIDMLGRHGIPASELSSCEVKTTGSPFARLNAPRKKSE